MTFASTEPGGNKGRHHHLSWSSSRWTGFYVNIFYNWASVSWFGNLAIFIFWQCWKPSCPPEWKLGAAFGFPSSRTFFYLWTTTRSVLRGLLAGWENMPKTSQVKVKVEVKVFFWVVDIEKVKVNYTVAESERQTHIHWQFFQAKISCSSCLIDSFLLLGWNLSTSAER